MIKVLVHTEALDDLKLCRKKKWYKGLGEEMPGICRLLIQDARMPGERLVHYIKSAILQNKTFHAGINLPGENTGKRKGPRIIYVKEDFDLIKVIYIGGHKDKRYDNSFSQVKLIEERYPSESYIEYTEGFNFSK